MWRFSMVVYATWTFFFVWYLRNGSWNGREGRMK